METILVTGGAGYIGSHVVREFLKKNYQVKVVDNLSTGHLGRLKGLEIEFHQFGIEEEKKFLDVLDGVDGLVHLAGSKSVEESMYKPEKYIWNNFFGTSTILKCLRMQSIKSFVFSSSSSVYYPKPQGKLIESDLCQPISPYGYSKLLSEKIIEYVTGSLKISSVCLRYFNVIGAEKSSLQDTSDFNLIPKTINRLRNGLLPVINGQDYETSDGTCVRDYVDVRDIARGHVNAYEHSSTQQINEIFNLGSGHGFSAKEILDEIFKILQVETKVEVNARRPGDPPSLVSEISKAKNLLSWEPKYSLKEMIESSVDPFSRLG